VTVADGDEAGEPRRSLALVAVGVAMLASLFLHAHPSIGRLAQWPWEHWSDTAPESHRADLVLWAAVGALAVLAGVGAFGRGGARWLLAPAILLAARCCAPRSALPVAAMSIVWLASTVALGAGLVARATRRPGAFRPLLVAGALSAVAILAVHFPGRGETSFLGERLAALPAAWRGDLLVEEVWRLHAPFLAQAAAVVLALLLAALPGRLAAGRVVALAALVALLLTWLFPAASLAAEAFDGGGGSAKKAAEIAASVWFGGGLGLALLGWLVVGSLARRAAEAREPLA
jgi:hypothetical protein